MVRLLAVAAPMLSECWGCHLTQVLLLLLLPMLLQCTTAEFFPCVVAVKARGGVAVKIFEQEQAAGSGTDAAAPTSPRRIKPKRWPPNVERSRFWVFGLGF
jgi:hypothetical protein